MSNFWGAVQKRPVFFVDRNEINRSSHKVWNRRSSKAFKRKNRQNYVIINVLMKESVKKDKNFNSSISNMNRNGSYYRKL